MIGSWYNVCSVLSVTFVTSKSASSVIEELKSFKEGLTVKLDSNAGQSVFILFFTSRCFFCDDVLDKKIAEHLLAMKHSTTRVAAAAAAAAALVISLFIQNYSRL